MIAEPPQTRDYDRRWWTLGVLCLSLVMVVVANASLNVALPTLVKDLHASSSALQWIVDAYSLVFAGMLLTAGALGDRYGRRLAHNGGLVVFGAVRKPRGDTVEGPTSDAPEARGESRALWIGGVVAPTLRPTKDKIASTMTAMPISRLIKVISSGSVAGNISRVIVRQCEKPTRRAADT